MSMDIASIVLMSFGGLLILAGIGTVLFQMVRRPPPLGHQLGVTVDALSKFTASTAYPGIIMILIGAMLLMAGGWISN
jgi:hypothetical protein